jgi:hypothetical protein
MISFLIFLKLLNNIFEKLKNKFHGDRELHVVGGGAECVSTTCDNSEGVSASDHGGVKLGIAVCVGSGCEAVVYFVSFVGRH